MSRLSLLLVTLALACDPTDKEADVDGLAGTVGDVPQDADGDGFLGDEDCNDGDASVGPGAIEVCDGIDNNCDGRVDEEVMRDFFTDSDGDGFGDPTAPVEACDQPPDTVPTATDCDDTDADVFPGAPELCNGIDDDCSGLPDEGLTESWMPDADGDGYGDDDRAIDTCSPDDGWVQVGGDCDDSESASFPGNPEVCDELDNDCNGDVDEGQKTTFYIDLDGDSWGDFVSITEACALPPGYAADPGDCDDGDALVNPDATELCNGIDDDCDSVIDEDEAADALIWYLDGDTDGYGLVTATTTACSQPSGYVSSNTDCDDSQASIYPGAAESCNGEDDDCDTVVDEDDAIDAVTFYRDADTDGYGDAATTYDACSAPSGYVASNTDCDDTDISVNPGAAEVCNDEDDDCDGDIDDDDSAVSGASTWYADLDSDGYGDASNTLDACDQPTSYTTDDQDCDDSDADVSPDGIEVCNSIDDDCDGDIDDDDSDVSGTATWYDDSDGDGYGGSTTIVACSAPSGAVSTSTDCDDSDAGVSPGASETCDGVDEDCDGAIDNGVLGTGAACPAEDCAEIIADNPSAADGSYELDFGTYTCDMTTDGGGWTLVGTGYVYGTGYTGTYHNSEGFSWNETLFAYSSGSAHAHCTYPSSLTSCNNLGFQFGSENWGLPLNWGASLCGLSTTSYTSATTYVGGYDFVVDRSTSTDTIRVGTLEGIASCTIGDNPGAAYVDIYLRQ